MIKNRIISICLCATMLFLMMFSNLLQVYANGNGSSTIDSKAYDAFGIIKTLQSDPNFISIYYVDYDAANIPIESTRRQINSIDEVVNGPKGYYYVDRGAGWIRANDKDLIGTSGIQDAGTAKISKTLESTFGHTIVGNVSVGFSFDKIKLGFEYAFKRLLRETDTTTIDYSMPTEPGKSLYLKAYTTNRKTEVYMKPNAQQFSALNTTYEPDGSWLKPFSFQTGEKLDLDSLVEKEERCILYTASPVNDNNNGHESDSSLDRDQIKSKISILNKQQEKLFDLIIDRNNVITIANAKDKQLDNTASNEKFFSFDVFDSNFNNRISVSLNGSDKASGDKLKKLDGFVLKDGDAIYISHKYVEDEALVLDSMVYVEDFLGSSTGVEIPVSYPISKMIIDEFYFVVDQNGLTLREKNPSSNARNLDLNQDYQNIISRALQEDKNDSIDDLNDLIINGDYEEIIEIKMDDNGNPITSESVNTDTVKEKSFIPPRDGTFVIDRGEGWISSEEKNKITTSIVPPRATSTINRSAKVKDEYIMEFSVSSSFTYDFITASLKIGAGPIMSSSNTITLGGSNAVNNENYTYMKAYALNHRLEVINVTNGKITDKATVFKAEGHWIVPILFNQTNGLNQKEYILKDNTKVLNYDDKFDGTQIVGLDTDIISGNMYIDSSNKQYETAHVESNKFAIPFTVRENGTYTIQSRVNRYDYPYLPFGAGLGRPNKPQYGFNFPVEIFEVDNDNLRKVNTVIYENKNATPTVGAIAQLGNNKYGDSITLNLQSGKTYLYAIDTQNKLGSGKYSGSFSSTSYLIKKSIQFIVNKK